MNNQVLIMMLKGGLPPTIAIAFYQSTPVASTYSTLGYFIAVISVLTPCILPRAILLQTVTLHLVSVCIGACIALLTAFCSTQARAHTTGPGQAAGAYNSSASAVSAIWLIFSLYWSNTLRAMWPQLQLPAIIYSIFAIVSSIYAPSFANMAAGQTFVLSLLKSFLTGIAISTAVSLIIFPTTSRATVFVGSAAYISLLRGALKAQTGYLHTLERQDLFRPCTTGPVDTSDVPETSPPGPEASFTEEVQPLRRALASINVAHAKLRSDLVSGKRETAYGKLGAADLEEMFKYLRMIMLPLQGMGTTIGMFERMIEQEKWSDPSRSDQDPTARGLEHDETPHTPDDRRDLRWTETIQTISEPLVALTDAMDEALQHAACTLELVKPLKKTTSSSIDADVEAQKAQQSPADRLEEVCAAFYSHRAVTLDTFCDRGGITVPATHEDVGSSSKRLSAYDQKRLYIVLYLDFLLHSTATSVLDLVRFADAKVVDGTMERARWIVPTSRHVREWAASVFSVQDANHSQHTPDQNETGGNVVYAGDSFHKKKDPEHLPPNTRWQHLTSSLENVSRFLASSSSGFGLRVAVATMSLGLSNSVVSGLW